MQKGFQAAGDLDVALGIKSPETAAQRAKSYAEFVVPQNTAALIGQVATIASAPLGIPARIALGATGAGLGAAAEGESLPRQGLEAVVGGVANTVGEAVGPVASGIVRGLSGAKQRIADATAKRVGQVADDLTTPHPDIVQYQSGRAMVGPQNSAELRDWAGQRAMQQASVDQGQTMETVDRLLAQTGQGARTGAARPTIRVQGQDMSVQEANDLLTRTGATAFHSLPSDRVAVEAQLEARQLYGAIRREMSEQIGLQNKLAGAIWEKGQSAYEAAVGMKDLLRRPGAFNPNRDRLVGGQGTFAEGAQEALRGEGGFSRWFSAIPRMLVPGGGSRYAANPSTQVNAGSLQAYLQSPEGLEYGVSKFGQEGYDQLLKALLPGRVPYQLSASQQGLVDVLMQDITRTFGMNPMDRRQQREPIAAPLTQP